MNGSLKINSGSVLLSQAFRPSIIDAGGLNFRVRDGNGCTSSAMTTGNFYLLLLSYSIFLTVPSKLHSHKQYQFISTLLLALLPRTKPRLISTGQLNTSQCLHPRPIYHLVFVESYQISLWENLS